MFTLTKKLPKRMNGVPEITEALQKMKDSVRGLSFEPVSHTYTFYGQVLKSVSSIVEMFHEPFDAQGTAAKCSINPKHKMFGKPVPEILKLWEENRDKSAADGTAVHEFGEACFLWCTGNEHLIDEKFQQRITTEGLVSLTPKEEAVARWWQALDENTYVPVSKETRLANPLLGYAGTFDLLLYNLQDKAFELTDYKTNKDLFNSYGKKLLPPLNFIPSDDKGKYTIQQNLYKIQLNNLGINVNKMKLIWLKENGIYEEIEIPEYSKLITFAIQVSQVKTPKKMLYEKYNN